MLLEFVKDVTCSDTGSKSDEWVQLRANYAVQITRSLVVTCYQISGGQVEEGGRCPRRVAARLILCSGRCLAAVVALSEASGWRLLGGTLLADVLETMRLDMTPLVHSWKLPVNDDDDAAAAGDVAAYLGLCSQVCDAASSFITSSSSATTKKGGAAPAAPAASHARAVLKLQVIIISKHHAPHSKQTAAAFTALTVSNAPPLPPTAVASLRHLLTPSPAAPSQRNRRHFSNTRHLLRPPPFPQHVVPQCIRFFALCKKVLQLRGGGGFGTSQATEAYGNGAIGFWRQCSG